MISNMNIITTIFPAHWKYAHWRQGPVLYLLMSSIVSHKGHMLNKELLIWCNFFSYTSPQD